MEQMCMHSHLRAGHEFHLYTYDPPTNVPAGVQLHDAADVLSPERIFRSSNGAVGDFANYFKYHVLRDQGGCWTEMDELCVRPWGDLGQFVSSEHVAGGGNVIDQAAINIEAGHPLMVSLVEQCDARLRDGGALTWGTFGVNQFAEAVRKLGLHVMPPGAFCPLPWWDAKLLIQSGFEDWGSAWKAALEQSHGIQLWNEAWRREGWDKDSVPAGSMYAYCQKWAIR